MRIMHWGAARQSACVPHHAPAFLPSTLLYFLLKILHYISEKIDYLKGPSNEISIAILLPVLNPVQLGTDTFQIHCSLSM